MKVSIAMAAYDGTRYLHAQLESFSRQTRLPDELVVTDDSPGDATSALIEDFAKSAPFPVRCVRNHKQLGPTRNFNHALSLASGDLIFLSDQDDVWLPEKIETVVTLAKAEPAKACFMNDAYMADGELRPTGTTKMQQIGQAGLPAEAMVMGCCMAIRRSLLDALLPIPESQPAHDNWLVNMSDLLGLTTRIPVPLQYYRRHGQNVSDYFVNRLQRPGLIERLSGSARRIVRRLGSQDGLLGELRNLEDALERIAERQDAFSGLVDPDRLAAACDGATDRARRLAARRDIRSQPRWRRPSPILQLWRSGGYPDRGGLASALKDLAVSPARNVELRR